MAEIDCFDARYECHVRRKVVRMVLLSTEADEMCKPTRSLIDFQLKKRSAVVSLK